MMAIRLPFHRTPRARYQRFRGEARRLHDSVTGDR